jgi:predicted small integral membrane protein
MCVALGLFASLVAFDNVADYGLNYESVRHVLSMDTTLPGNAAMYRAVTNPALWQAAYDLIIAGEAVTGLLFIAAAVALWRARRAPSRHFQAAKNWANAAGTAGFLVWFFGFMVIGGEWFAMWQSARWNGQEGAFRFYMTILAVLIVVNQPDPELSDPA